MKTRLIPLIALLLALLSCQDREQAAPTAEDKSLTRETVLASSSIKKITVQDLDEALRAERRERPGLNISTELYEKTIKKIMIEAILLKELEESDFLEDPRKQLLLFQKRRTVISDFCSEKYLQKLKSEASTEELEKFFKLHEKEYKLPSKLMVYHIFLHQGPEKPESELLQKAEELRSKIHDLKSFQDMASQFSDSETKIRGGQLGWVQAGIMAPALEEVLFSMEPHVVSQPIKTTRGIHLFWVDEIYETVDYGFEEISGRVAEAYALEQSAENFKNYRDSDNLKGQFSQANAAEILKALQEKNQELVLVKGPEFEFKLGQMINVNELALVANLGALATQVYQNAYALLQQEQFIRFCQSLEFPEAVIQKKAEEESQQEKLNLARQGLLLRMLEQDTPRLEQFFSTNQNRFASPIRWKAVRVILRPQASDFAKAQNQLLELRQKVLTEKQDIKSLAESIGAKAETLDWKSLRQFQGLSTKLAEAVSLLDVGEISLPVRIGNTIQLLQVVDRQDPTPLDFQKARGRVLVEYQKAYADTLAKELDESLLKKYNFQIEPKKLEQISGLTLAGFPGQALPQPASQP